MNTDTYSTSDLYYASYLKVAGLKLIGTDRENGRVYFVFEGTEFIKDLEIQYYNRTAKVPAMTFTDEIKAMKSLTHHKMR